MKSRSLASAIVLGVTASIALCVSAACSSSSSAGSSSTTPATNCAQPTGCGTPDPASTDLTTPVSFATDIVPIFQSSCALSSSCHSLKVGGPSSLYLGGPASQPADAAGIIAATVGVPSVELASMPYVTAGNPAQSYLMHKMDGDVCEYASQCGATPQPSCGVVMPQGACALDGTVRDKVRRWIAQGAANN